MGYDITLEKNATPCLVPRHSEGGQYALGGTVDAHMYITGNYTPLWSRAFGPKPEGPNAELYGIGPWLQGLSAAETLAMLQAGVANLGDEQPDNDYWKPCAGNACHVLRVLIGWAANHPDGIWNIDGG